jgi:gamma-glutamyltranspeptidase/glutathione hydrolase
VLEILNILDHTDIAKRGPTDPEAWYLFAQASRLAYADRDHYEGDPDFVTTPVTGLLDPAYGAARAALIPSTGAAAPPPGRPPGAPQLGPDGTHEPGGTTHFVIVDRKGNIVSMTTTVESVFGSGRMAAGMFLNNQLTDFSSPTGVDGRPAANAPGPGKRPRSSMSPVIVFDPQGRPVAAFGSPGGNSIVAYVAKTLVAWIDWKLPLQAAVNLPHVVARGGVVSVEKGMDPVVIAGLRAHGLEVRPDAGESSGLNGFALRNGVLETAQDPRREAVARQDPR